MAIVNKPNTFSSNTTISSSEVNSNFDTLYNEFNGSISAANLADDAVTSAKLADNAVVTANITDDAVTPAKITNNYRFAAYRSTAINTTPAAVTVLPCATEAYDTNNNYDTTTFRYTAPVGGIYHFDAAILSGGSATSRLFLTFFRSGTEVSRGDDRSVSTFATTISRDILLTAGQYVEVRYYAADTIPIATTFESTFFSGHLVA